MTIEEAYKQALKEEEVFSFPSKTQEGVFWTTIKEEGKIICNCPGFRKHRPCKHVKTFYKFLFDYPLENYGTLGKTKTTSPGVSQKRVLGNTG